METQPKALEEVSTKKNEVSLVKSLLLIIVGLVLAVGIGIIVGKMFFWNQYDQVPVVDRQINKLLIEIKKIPDKPDNYIELGNLYLEKKDWTKAEENFQTAVKLEPKGTRAQYNLAVTYMAQKRYLDAERILVPLASQYPNLDYIQFNTGVVFFELGKYDQAMSYLLTAAKLQPGGADIWFYLGQTTEKSGKKLEAQKYYEKALTYYPTYKEALEALNRVKN